MNYIELFQYIILGHFIILLVESIRISRGRTFICTTRYGGAVVG
jgi:hypothetical protein